MGNGVGYIGLNVLKQEAKGLQALAAKLDKKIFTAAVASLHGKRMIFLSGIGKSGHVCRKAVATMISLGTPAMYIHPTEAAHGDMGILCKDDALVVMSRSGTASELYPIVSRAKNLGAPTLLISESNERGLSLKVDRTLVLPNMAEAWGHAPTTSTVMQMALGDAIAVALAELNKFTEEDFRATHPGGSLGGP